MEDIIEKRIKEIIFERLGVSKTTPNSRFAEDLGADSLNLVELIVAFEKEFQIDILDEEAERIIRVKDAIGLIKSKRNRAYGRDS